MCCTQHTHGPSQPTFALHNCGVQVRVIISVMESFVPPSVGVSLLHCGTQLAEGEARLHYAHHCKQVSRPFHVLMSVPSLFMSGIDVAASLTIQLIETKVVGQRVFTSNFTIHARSL